MFKYCKTGITLCSLALKYALYVLTDLFNLQRCFLTWATGSCPCSCAPPPSFHFDPQWRRRCPEHAGDSGACACASWKPQPGLMRPPHQMRSSLATDRETVKSIKSSACKDRSKRRRIFEREAENAAVPGRCRTGAVVPPGQTGPWVWWLRSSSPWSERRWGMSVSPPAHPLQEEDTQ